MVDDVTPMPSAEDLDAQQRAWNELANKIDAARKKLQDLLRTRKEDSQEVIKARDAVAGLEQEQAKLVRSIGGQAAAYLKSQRASQQYSSELESLRSATKGLNIVSDGWMNALKNVGGTLAAVGLTAVALQNQFVQGVINPLGTTQDIVKGMPRSFQAMNTILRGQADLLNLAGRAHIGLGNSMKQGRVTAREMTREIGRMQRQYNISADLTKKFHDETAHLEGMLGKVNKTVSAGGRPMLNSAKVMNAAAAAGVKLADVGGKVRKMMEMMGATSGDAALDFAAFKAAAKAGGLSVEFAREQILKATEPLAIFKKGASEAKDVWAVFAKSLREEIAPEQIGAIVQSVTQGIASMNFQTRAFVSQMSGAMRGVSALGGALRMEMNLRRPGGLARNLRETMQAMQRVTGGGPVTMEQAIRDPSQEMRFQLQRQMIGQTMGVKGEQQQARILEVMQGIQRGSMTNIDASKELASITRSGEDLQRASTTAIEKIANLATRRNEILKSLTATLEPLKTQLGQVQQSRFGRVEVPRPREARVAGAAIRTGLRQTAARASKEMGRLWRKFRDPLAAFTQGLAGRTGGAAAPAGPPVRPGAPRERVLAERRLPQAARRILAEPRPQQRHLELEEVLRRPGREVPGPPTEMYPYPPPRRRIEPPAGGMPAPGPAGPGAGPAGPGAGPAPEAAAAGEQAAAGAPMNVTVGVMCAHCHKELVKKSLAEMSTKRDSHITGTEYGNWDIG